MPYASNSDLPASIRRLYRDECQTVFRRAHDTALAQYRDAHDADLAQFRVEGRAMATAHAAAKRCEERTGKAMAEHMDSNKMKAMATKMHAMADEMDAMAGMESTGKAEMSAAEANDLPDSAFGCIDAGGTKDESGRTVPRSLRHYPHHTASGALDLPHLRNALARSAQPGTADCGKAHLKAHARTAGIGGR